MHKISCSAKKRKYFYTKISNPQFRISPSDRLVTLVDTSNTSKTHVTCSFLETKTDPISSATRFASSIAAQYTPNYIRNYGASKTSDDVEFKQSPLNTQKSKSKSKSKNKRKCKKKLIEPKSIEVKVFQELGGGYVSYGRKIYDIRILPKLIDDYITSHFTFKIVYDIWISEYVSWLKSFMAEYIDNIEYSESKHYAGILLGAKTTLCLLMNNYYWAYVPSLRCGMNILLYKHTSLKISFDVTFRDLTKIKSTGNQICSGRSLTMFNEFGHLLELFAIANGSESHANIIMYLCEARLKQLFYGDSQLLKRFTNCISSDHPRNKRIADYVDEYLQITLNRDYINNCKGEKIFFRDLTVRHERCILHYSKLMSKALIKSGLKKLSLHADLDLFRQEITRTMNSIVYGDNYLLDEPIINDCYLSSNKLSELSKDKANSNTKSKPKSKSKPKPKPKSVKINCVKFVQKFSDEIEKIDDAMIKVLKGCS